MTLHSAWCLTIWDGLREGGVWGVPPFGLVFRKQENKFVLIAAMPWMEGMPVGPTELQLQQRGDFNATREEFRVIGVDVVLAPDFHWPDGSE